MYWYILTPPPPNRVTKGVVMVLGYIRSLLKPAPKTPHASLGTGMQKAPWTLLPLSAPPPFEVASDTSAALFCDVEQGEETTLT